MSWVKGKIKEPYVQREGMGKRITDLRISMNLTQKDLGNLACINRVSIQKYEIGEIVPRTGNLQKLADVLGTTSEYLISGDENRKTSTAVLVPKKWNVQKHEPRGRIYCPYCGKGNGFKVRELNYNQLPFPKFCAWCGRKVMT